MHQASLFSGGAAVAIPRDGSPTNDLSSIRPWGCLQAYCCSYKRINRDMTSGENFVDLVKDCTGGEGVAVVYDSIGADTFAGSLDCLRPRSTLVSFGTASGAVPPLDLGILGAKGSLFVTRPSIAHYTAKRDEFEAESAAIFDMIRSGAITPVGLRKYALRDSPAAQRDLEERRTSGSLVLIP